MLEALTVCRMVKWKLADSDTYPHHDGLTSRHAACGMCSTKRVAYIWKCHICGTMPEYEYVKCGPQSAIETIFTHAWRRLRIACKLFISAAGP